MRQQNKQQYYISEEELKTIQSVQQELIGEVARICKKCNIHFNMVSSTVAVFLKTIPTIDLSPILYRNPYLVLIPPFNRILHNALMPAGIKDYHINNERVYGFYISVFSPSNTKCTFRRCLLSSSRHNPAQSCIIRHRCVPICNSGTHKILSR